MKISPLGEHFGAQVHNVDLRGPLDAPTVVALNEAFVDNAVLCVRQQSFSSPDELLAAARQFGDPIAPVTATYRLPGYDVIEALSNQATDPRTGDGKPLQRGGSWHTDHSNLLQPPKATLLYAIELPDSGGNTEFVNLALAYDRLSEKVKSSIEGRRVFHAYLSRRAPRQLLSRTKQEEQASSGVWQPLVREHPQTRRPSLYLNPMRDDAVEGLNEQASNALLDQLYAHCDALQFRYSHRWQAGDVLLWDNRCTWHRATFDFDPVQRRYLHRIMLQGDAPYAPK